MQRHPMTPEGHKKLSETLKHLEEVVRPQIVKDIEEARPTETFPRTQSTKMPRSVRA